MAPYAIPPESADLLNHERYILASDFISGAGYGIQAVLYIICASYLWHEWKLHHQHIHAILLLYMTLLFLTSSVVQVAQAHLIELMFVDNKSMPGGPWVYLELNLGGILDLLSQGAELALLAMCSIFMIWRCWVVWFSAGHHIAYLIILFPALILIAAIITGTIVFISFTHPTSPLALAGGPHGMTWTTTYYTLIFSPGIVLTILILIRLMIHKYHTPAGLAHAKAGDYTSLVTILVESSAVCSVMAVACLVTYGTNSPMNLPFADATIAAQQICEYLIIARLAHGRAWKEDTMATMHFEARQVDASVNDSEINISGRIADSTKLEQARV
ncbi:hypothetical protein BD779DRAFT_1590339 [Infundibulicybe gibba]|nr:hypothetical protein BD779DRAFT_1590339 [Infundibulicybe gibba]